MPRLTKEALIIQSLVDSAQLDIQRGLEETAEEKYRIALSYSQQHQSHEDSPAFSYSKYLVEKGRMTEAIRILQELQNNVSLGANSVRFIVSIKIYSVLMDILPKEKKRICYLIHEMYNYLYSQGSDQKEARVLGRKRLEGVKEPEAEDFLLSPDEDKIELLKHQLGSFMV